MTALTYQEIVQTLGPLDDATVNEILATGASSEELMMARSWLDNDEAPINAGDPLASGRIARLMDLLEAADGFPDEAAG